MGEVISAAPVPLDAIRHWRDAYVREMNCQVVHDSIHVRAGWTREYEIRIGGEAAGYGSLAVGGPWTAQPALYEFHLDRAYRGAAIEAFGALIDASSALAIEIQSNDRQALTMLHTFGRNIRSESILFEEHVQTRHTLAGARFRHPDPAEAPTLSPETRRWSGVVEMDGVPAATGGVLFHYNPPYGDIFMDVEEPYRRRGIGTYLVQELKRLCHEAGIVPAARCSPSNLASRLTLQKAGFAPCGHILNADLDPVSRASSSR